MDGADARVLTPAEAQGGLPQPLCISHSAVCEALCRAAERAGATVLYGAQNLCVAAGVPPMLSCRIDGKVTEWRPRLVVGADGRESSVRRKLGFVVKSDPPHHLVGGMLVDGVPEWRQDAWAFGTEGQLNFMVLPQGGRRLRLYAAWASELNERFAGPDRRRRLLQAFGALRSLRQAQAIARASPIGPFNAFANEDRWVDDPVLPGVVLVGDAAGTNDPVIAQGLAVALRDVRLVSDAILQGSDAPQALACYAKERWERMRRLRVAGRLAAKLHVEFGPAAQDRRLRVLQALPEGHVLSPLSAVHLGPDRVPAEAFGVAALERLLLV
jgi:2-polyprenyl-6-methoxyphenol hydroxylase-like FAD-dependent oxidoreductase